MFDKNNSPGRYCDIWDYFLQFNGQLYEFWSFFNLKKKILGGGFGSETIKRKSF